MAQRLNADAIINTIIPVDAIEPHKDNYNQHPDEQIAGLAASHSEFGQYRSVVVWARPGGKYVQVAGHGYLTAAKGEGLTEVRCDVLPEDTDPVTIKAIMVADNEHAKQSSSDDEMLAHLLQEQADAGFDLAALGSDEETLRQMLEALGDGYMGGDGEGDEDDFEAEPDEEQTRVKVGDVWQLGRHRLLVGDCTKPENIEALMQNERAALCFTSPPYNAGDSEKLTNNSHTQDTKYVVGGNDAMASSEYLDLLCSFTDLALSCCEYVFVNIQILAGNKLAVLEYLHKHRKHFADIAIWCKSNAQPAMARRVMTSSFEAIVILSPKEYPTRAIGTNDFRGDISNVYSSSIQGDNKFASIHAATFPLHFPVWFIQNFTNTNDIIFEPFGGTGTTLIACENLHRKCRIVELVPMYADVILSRWENHTNQTAQLISRIEEVVNA